MNKQISFRAVTEKDIPFLKEVYASTRQEEMALLPHWSIQEKAAFIEQQFLAQHIFYQQQYKKADFLIIQKESQPIGRLYIDRREKEIRVIDITLLPAYRGQGTGSRLMRDILQEGAQIEKPVTIHVEQNNPALRLYRHLGFRKISERGIYYLMEWKPAIEEDATITKKTKIDVNA